MEYITPGQMLEEEKRAEAKGITVETLMENAGKAVAEVVGKRIEVRGKRIVVISGLGNNGGDGFVAARYLSLMGASVTVVLLGRPESIKTGEARKNWDRLEGVKRVIATTAEEIEMLGQIILGADVVVDAIFGTGIRGEVGEPQRTAIDFVNRAKGLKVAVDIPSGLDPGSGATASSTVVADITVTLHRPKVGLKGKEKYTGEVVVVPIGIQ